MKRQGSSYGVSYALPLEPGTYRLTCHVNNCCLNIGLYDDTGTHLGQINNVINESGDVVAKRTFTIPENTAIANFCFYSYDGTGEITGTVSDIQVEMSSDYTSYESYNGTNTDYVFGTLGKNKFDPNCDMLDYSAYSKNGDEITQSGSDGRGWVDASFKSIHLKAGTYTLTCSDENNFNLHTSIDNYEANISLTNGGGTFTLSQDCDVKIKHSVKSGNSYPTTFTVQLELGDTATAYEPYNSSHTVYGGWVDLISGEVREEWKKYEFTGNENIIYYTNWYANGQFYTSTYSGNPDLEQVPYYNQNADSIYCNMLKPVNSSYFSAKEGMITVVGNYSNPAFRYIIFGADGFGTTAEECKEKLSELYENDTPLTVVAKVAEPFIGTYHLSPTQLQTFLGQNNVWSNADYIEIEYDLHETQTILQRKQYIMANQPHIVTPADIPLQNFTTNLVAPLKECKVYFNPVQEGTGDPSPENIRAISGWTELTLYHAPKNLLPKTWFTDSIKGTFGTGSTSISAATNAKCASIYVGKNTALRFDKTSSNTIMFAFTDERVVDRTQTLYDAINCANRTGLAMNSGDHPWLVINTSNSSTMYPNLSNVDGILKFSGQPSGYEAQVDWQPLDIDWTSDAGTVYGGYLDLITGELTATHAIATLDGTEPNWYYYKYDGYDMPFIYMHNFIDGGVPADNYFVSNYFAKNNDYGNTRTAWTGWNDLVNKWTRLYLDSNTFADVTEWRTYLAEHPLQIGYTLHTPITYQLSPIQLKALRGTNNIWSNANDNISVKYWKY